MSYEHLRSSLSARLLDRLPPALLNAVLCELDIISDDFEISRKSKDLIVTNDIPEIVKLYVASMAVENCKKTTLYDYKINLLLFFRTVCKSFTSVTTNDVRVFLFNQQAEKQWSPETTEHKRVIINSFFNWCVDNEYIARNPARQIKPLKLPKKKLKPLQQFELECFRNACQSDRERALVDFLYSTGCRVSEAAAMLLTDINWSERSVLVRHGKGDKERITYFNAEAELSMRRYLENRKGTDNHLFIAGRAPYVCLSRESLEADIRRIRKRIPDQLSVKVTPHTLRRTMGTSAVKHGCPIEQVKELLGHESLDTTMKYVTVSQEEVKYSHQKYLAG